MLYALTGPLTLVIEKWLRAALGPWAILADARVGIMPLSALALLTCGIFAPQVRHRWLLIGAAAADGVIFVCVVLFHFVLPSLRDW